MSSIELIETLYDACKRKDYALFRRICDDGLEWIQNQSFPNDEHHRGVDAVIEKIFEKIRCGLGIFQIQY